MAEAEDVLIDAARHATVLARDIWRRHHPRPMASGRLDLPAVTERLGLLIYAVFGIMPAIRAAQPPAPPTLLQRLARRGVGPLHTLGLPATDGATLWLPKALDGTAGDTVLDLYRAMALQQAMRLARGAPQMLHSNPASPAASIYLLLEAAASDYALSRLLPGARATLNHLRRFALQRRPPLAAFPPARRPLEHLARAILQTDSGDAPSGIDIAQDAAGLYRQACEIAEARIDSPRHARHAGLLLLDLWSGELRVPPSGLAPCSHAEEERDLSRPPPRSARLERRPAVREPRPDEDDTTPGAWMVQTAQPHEHVEDPLGLQRPTDRDEATAAEDFAESLAELPEARLASTPGRPKEILLSDDPLESRGRPPGNAVTAHATRIAYPEWDYRAHAYREPGAIVHVQTAACGPPAWVASTLERHASMLHAIRRRFELLRARPMRLHRQLDGDDIDLDAYIDAHASFRAGQPMPQALYQTQRRTRRDMAISLVIDISGSTDGWISAHRRIIDIEREALLLVCIALDGLGEPYGVQAFSGEGPEHVAVRTVKEFDEPYGQTIALRIAGLEPEWYTRTGAALRHASALLMRQRARHRLLLLLSDGKPNDADIYEGRYGLEDTRQAIIEAEWQGIFPFCLTIDRHAASYLPAVFGKHRYALLSRPEQLPTALLDWMKRLAGA